jgi:hypothetical protein
LVAARGGEKNKDKLPILNLPESLQDFADAACVVKILAREDFAEPSMGEIKNSSEQGIINDHEHSL